MFLFKFPMEIDIKISFAYISRQKNHTLWKIHNFPNFPVLLPFVSETANLAKWTSKRDQKIFIITFFRQTNVSNANNEEMKFSYKKTYLDFVFLLRQYIVVCKIYVMVDLCYCKIYIMLWQYIRSSIKHGNCAINMYFLPPFSAAILFFPRCLIISLTRA